MTQDEETHRALVYGDCLAARVSWTPMATPAASFRTHEAVRVSDQVLELRPTREAKQFGWFLTVLPLLSLIMPLLFGRSTGKWGFASIFVVVSVLFSGFGLFALLTAHDRFRFDLARRRFSRSAVRFVGRHNPGFELELVRARAIQVVPTTGGMGADSYRTYEMNVVLDDASRVALLSHARESDLHSDARSVASFLGLPLWSQE